jgi:hypothetical protein
MLSKTVELLLVNSRCRFQTVTEILRGHFSRLGWQLLQKIKPTYPHQCCLSCPMNQLEPPEAGLPEKRASYDGKSA